MAEFTGEIQKKEGLPPGTLVFTGEKRIERVEITVIDYDKDKCYEKKSMKSTKFFPSKMNRPSLGLT